MPGETKARAFINYRSEDTGATASRLYKDLERLLMPDQVFLDHEGLEGGSVWPERLKAEVERSTAMLVLIGSRWLEVHDRETGDSRLNLPDDWVLLEIESALARRILLLPLLVDDASLPSKRAQQTVPSIRELAKRQDLPLRRKDWDSDIKRLLETLEAQGFKLKRKKGPPPPPVPDPDDPRRKVLWRLAYAFLRLDQLPSGGWAKSLPGWLEGLLEGPEDIVVSGETRTKGGTDLTSRAFLTYLRFLRRLNCDKPTADEPTSKKQIAFAVRDNIADKIGWDGGVGVGKPGRVANHIRHTLMGLLTFLYISECTGNFPEKAISRVEKYLRKNLPQWTTDKSHPFACFCILAKIREKLGEKKLAEMDFAGEWNPKQLIQIIDKVLPEMSRFLCNRENFPLVPRDTCRLHATDFAFQPYEGFWRMERSNLLMYLPLLVREDGEEFYFQNSRLHEIVKHELGSVLRDLAPLPEGLQGRCVSYHRDAAVNRSHPLDFGLTAELLSVLTMPAIRGLVNPSNADLRSLEAALIRGLGHYHDWPIFKFTHSVSLGQYLEVVRQDLISVEAIRDLDDRIDRVIEGAVTECELDELCKSIVQDAFGNPLGDDEQLVPAMRDMLVTKLASGEHIPRDGDARPVLPPGPTFAVWRDKADKALDATIRFFDGPGGEDYARRYEGNPIQDYVTGICRLVNDGTSPERKALDMGCGPGQYAALLKNKGYKVELADASIQMLRRARERLGEKAPNEGELRRIENLARDYRDQRFDIIFACAMMIHVPRDKAAEVYREFHVLIRPGGALFVNFKIGDHTLIGIGERYHEYYRDYRGPWRMLEEAGFRVREISMTFNRETMYWDAKCIHWANFFCSRP